MMSLSSAALRYAELGYPVFPCVPGGKAPLTRRGFKDADTDFERIEAWWQQYPSANIGIPTAGLLVVDIDGAENPWLSDDSSKYEELARGALSLTPGGGRHYIFRQPKGRAWGNTSGKLARHVDTRANGGYIVVPPSVVGDKPYRWAETLELDIPQDALSEPPCWLINLLEEDRNGLFSLHGTSNSAPPPQFRSAPSCLLADCNTIPSGQRNSTLARLAGTMRRVGMSEDEILAALTVANRKRCIPPLSDAEVARTAASVARYEPDQLSVAYVEDHWAQAEDRALYVSAEELCRDHLELRKPVIHGLLRESETMNVIAASKSGKSWIVLNLALSLVTGLPWLGFPTEPGRVLLIDNELHAETLANRIPRVAEAMSLPKSTWEKSLYVQSLRGRLEDLFRMEGYFRSLPEGFFKLIILDAFYRFMPRNMDENDNGTMANLYNVIDRCAAHLNAGFVLIHHTTKGLQSAKAVTDVGAGAGSQSRAADSHFILRPHESDGCLSVDAVARSWPPPEAFVIRKAFPLWKKDTSLDPTDLQKPNRVQRKSESSEDEIDRAETIWTTEQFVARFITSEPKSHARIHEEAESEGLSSRRVKRLIELAEEDRIAFRWSVGPRNTLAYSTVEPPEEENHDDSKRAAVKTLLSEEPELHTNEVAKRCGVSRQYVYRIKKEV